MAGRNLKCATEMPCDEEKRLLEELHTWYGKCSDCMLHPMYVCRLNALMHRPLTQGLIDFLCEKATCTRMWPELRLKHLRILLLNESARGFDLKQWYMDGWKRSRRLWLRLFYIRGYAMYATEQEMIPVMQRFGELLQKNRDDMDYACILSCAGLPYLAEKYGYPCIEQALAIARAEYVKINALLQGHWTMNEQLEPVSLVSDAEALSRMNAYLIKSSVDIESIGETNCVEKSVIQQDVICLEPGWHYSITVTCEVLKQEYPTVPTLSIPEGQDGYVMLDTSRYPAAMRLNAKKSVKLSARMSTVLPAYFLVQSNGGRLQITFQSWVTAAGSMPQWHESTAHSALKMTREVLAPNRIRYGCNSAQAEMQQDCFVFVVEWTPVPDNVLQ